MSTGLQSGTIDGLVVRTESGYHRVQLTDRVVVCRAPKRLYRGQRTVTTAVVIGDQVRIQMVDDGTGVIQEVLPRRNELVRGAAGGSHYLDVIAANLDRLIAVHSLDEPEFHGPRLDRFLLLAEVGNIPAMVCLNKCDLLSDADARRIGAIYRDAGYHVVFTSIRTGHGIESLREAMAEGINAMVGPSGVGKSSLVNALEPGLSLRTGEISESTGKGKHTTTTAELLALSSGGYIADTPGLRELAIREVDATDVDNLFPEFRPYIPHCKFSDCTHRREQQCAVQKALAEGIISQLRYDSYLHVFEQVREHQSF